MSNIYDLIVIGAGPAGITASVYASRRGMHLLVISKDIGGQAAISGDIENYTGYQFITGPELAKKFEEHMRKFNIEIKEPEEVIGLSKKQDGVIEIKSSKNTYFAKTAIIASGKRSRELNVPGEKEFKNKGLTYCAICDGPLFSQRTVAVVGGGNSALDATLQLMNIARHIYLINITSALSGDKIMQEKVINSDKVTILNNTQITAISGDNMVNSIKIKDNTGKEKTLSVEGVFVEIGLVPNSEFAKDIEKNEHGEIKIDSFNRTNIEGIFACGDVTDVMEKQIIIACGEGAKAALSAFRYLAQRK
jgi:thioredoxin-disulfide reductase